MVSNEVKAKTLFLWFDSNEFYAANVSKQGLPVANIYRKTSVFMKVLRRAYIKLNFLSIYPWLDSWRNDLNLYDTVIVPDSVLTPSVVEYINRKNHKARVIIWYWNPVDKSVPVASFYDKKCEIWTFDELDAHKYGIKLNTQYYFKNIEKKEDEIINDILFVGGDKGRLQYLLNLQKEFELCNLITDFHIVKTAIKLNSNYDYKARIKYSEVLKKINSCKAILDIVSVNQTGLTLRPLEALFHNKKLITNDKSILNRDFYNPNNIFILDHDKKSEISDFLDRPFIEIEKKTIDNYDFENWLSRFCLSENS